MQGRYPFYIGYLHLITRIKNDKSVGLKGETGKRYVGITNDPPRRLKEHKSKNSKGSQVIGDFTVLHTEQFSDYKAARNRENFLKSGQGRQWLNNLESNSEPATKPAGKSRSDQH